MNASLAALLFLTPTIVSLGDIPEHQITWPAGVKSKRAESGSVYAPLTSMDTADVGWFELLVKLNLDLDELGSSSTARKLPAADGGQVDNLVALYREALRDTSVTAAVATRNPGGVPDEHALHIVPLLRDRKLQRRDWNPATELDDDGIVVLELPWIDAGREYYTGAVYLAGDLITIKEAECDYRAQRFDVGHNYAEIWPIQDSLRRGRNRFGDFQARDVFTIQKLTWPYRLAYRQWFIDHYVGDTLMADFGLTPDRFPGYSSMKWMRGRVVFLPVVHEGDAAGFIVVSSVGFRTEIAVPLIGVFTDKPKDHKKAMRAFLGNWKRRVEVLATSGRRE